MGEGRLQAGESAPRARAPPLAAITLVPAGSLRRGTSQVAAKYALVVKQNKKMSAEIAKFGGLVAKGESEVAFVPPNKRIRLFQQKLA